MDVFTEAARSIALRSTLAPLFAFGAGALSSLGPCVAPRLLAVVSCVGARPAREARVVVAVFLAGLTAAYASFGMMSSLLGKLIDVSRWTYGAVALALLVGGIVTLLQAKPSEHDSCNSHAVQPQATSFGGVFLLGASFAFVIAPCCTPLVAVIVAYTADVGDPFSRRVDALALRAGARFADSLSGIERPEHCHRTLAQSDAASSNGYCERNDHGSPLGFLLVQLGLNTPLHRRFLIAFVSLSICAVLFRAQVISTALVTRGDEYFQKGHPAQARVYYARALFFDASSTLAAGSLRLRRFGTANARSGCTFPEPSLPKHSR